MRRPALTGTGQSVKTSDTPFPVTVEQSVGAYLNFGPQLTGPFNGSPFTGITPAPAL